MTVLWSFSRTTHNRDDALMNTLTNETHIWVSTQHTKHAHTKQWAAEAVRICWKKIYNKRSVEYVKRYLRPSGLIMRPCCGVTDPSCCRQSPRISHTHGAIMQRLAVQIWIKAGGRTGTGHHMHSDVSHTHYYGGVTSLDWVFITELRGSFLSPKQTFLHLDTFVNTFNKKLLP